jgi:hypothetical protein
MTVSQEIFTSAIFDPNSAVPIGLLDPVGRPAGKRFNVYRNNVVVSLMDAMEVAFPVINKLIGAQKFRNISAVYVRKFPPETPMLMFYGTAFPAFLEGFEALTHLPYLADVARLELARRSAYHGSDTTPVIPETFSQIAPDRLMESRLTFAPTLRIVESLFPIVAIWEASTVEGAPKPEPLAQTALITRRNFDVEMRVISTGQSVFLNLLMGGSTLDQAFETALTRDVNFELSEAIGLMFQCELITKINP